MKKKNYKCCGKKYNITDTEKYNYKCTLCKKGGINNKILKCTGIYDCNKQGKIRRQNTAYHKISDNYIVACDCCFKEIEDNWSEMWADYYSMIR